MFQPFEGIPDYPALEARILQWWDEKHIFDRLREQNRGGEPWRFQDGPITANNPMGVHHAWGRTYKDIFNRFHAMRGRRLRYQNGFDGQGLWVEVEVEKALGFKGKPDIVAYGLENFSRACRERVEKYAVTIEEQSRRLGMWMDWEKSYYTLDDSNIEHIWLFLKRCHEQGWLAPDYRVMPWCPRCETSLSQHESADSYKDITHRSVFIRCPVVSGQGPVQDGDSFLVWTTTPWTLTANVALAINPELTYVRARSEDAVYILSKETARSALKPDYEILQEVPGHELIGLKYFGPFDDTPFQAAMNEQTPRRSVAWETVGESEGTGIVHIAPGCGAEDFELGKREGLGFIVPTDTGAHFLPGAGDELAGKHALADVETVFAELEKRNRLYRIQRYKHSYPHCWRCDSELIFYATQGWFIKADAGPSPARPRLRAAAQTVRWIPEYAGKRMDEWLSNMGDWNISRRRFWGLPLPIYVSDDGEFEVIGSRQELRERAVDPVAVDALPELHVPWIDEIKIRSKDGTKVLSRVPDVGDAWLDAGIVPFSTLGYNGATDIRMKDEGRVPSGQEMKDTTQISSFILPPSSFQEWYPADFITEMREQIRLWFYSMLFMSVALEDRAPYRTAMVYETMLDENGDRISKRKQNGVPYDEAVATVGADPMRWTFCGNPLNKDIRFGYGPIHESRRRLLTLWNIYAFFVTYANLDKPDLANSDQPSAANNILDRWILARLQGVIRESTGALEGFEAAGVSKSVEAFIEDLSTWYVRRSRSRFWKGESDEDKQAAYQTLHHVLLTLCKLIAPVIPFTAEEMYQNLKTPLDFAPESIHLCAWPTVQSTLDAPDLVREAEGVLTCVSLGHAARKESGVRTRQPLSKVLVQVPDEASRRGIESWHDTILEELNVKAIELLDDAGDLVSYKLRANLPKLGKKLGKQMGAVRTALESADASEARRIGEAVKRGESVSIEVGGQPLELEADEVLVQVEQQTGYASVSENGWMVALDTTLDEDLIDEGVARDFVRAIQNARKEAGFEVSDRIAILLSMGDESTLDRVLEKFGDTIQNETLAEELRLVDADYPQMLEVKLGEETVRLRVEKFEEEA